MKLAWNLEKAEITRGQNNVSVWRLHSLLQYQWPFQEPKLEVPTIYKAHVRPM